MKLLILLSVILFSSCTMVMNKHRKGIILYKNAKNEIKISEEIIKLEACNRLIFFPYELSYFNNQEYFSKALEKYQGVGLADVQVKTYFYWKWYFLGYGLCEQVKGKIITENK